MTPETRRRIISAVVLLFAAGLIALAFLRPREEPPPVDASAVESSEVDESIGEVENVSTTPTQPVDQPKSVTESVTESVADAVADAQDQTVAEVTPTSPAKPSTNLVARAPGGAVTDPASLGGLDALKNRFQITFSPLAAGIESIVFSDFWTEAKFARAATQHTRDDGATPLPDDAERYSLNASTYGSDRIPMLAARVIEIDGARINLFGNVWAETAPGAFQTELVDPETGDVQFRIDRRFELAANGYDLTLTQRVENLGGSETTPANVRWIQYGPGDLDRDRGSFIEVRRFHFGYLLPPNRDPAQANVTANGQLYERGEVLGRIEEWYNLPQGTPISPEMLDLWPNETSREQTLELSWFGTTNRYFTLCVHAVYDPPERTDRKAGGSIQSVRPIADLSAAPEKQTIVTELHGPVKVIAPGAAANWDMGVYAGPLERSVLETGEPYVGLNMRDLIVYLMSGCCTFCTFSWLADGLVVFLSFLHGIVFDWALAIVLLVCIVRLILHPVMRKGQIQMQRVSRLMTELKPELDALQKKYKEDPSRMQSEQRRLFMERGVNPMGCVGGLLPTFLQMPIWIALYAMLFFAFELRQEPAFFGLFQLLPDMIVGNATLFGNFLGDLSRPDHFVEFGSPVDIYITKLTGINLLPLLMGFIFYVQQKYMSPPPSPNMTPEQLQQQKIMKIMMVVLFPVMLFQAPSGLTLYILTSSSIGIIEGKRIRKHIDSMDLTKPVPQKPVSEKKKARKDKLGRMYAEKLEEARRKQAAKRSGSKKSFKKRDG